MTKGKRLRIAQTFLSPSTHSQFKKQKEKTMNKNNISQSTIEAERKTLDTVFIILLIFTAISLAFCLGYFVAMNEALALVKTTLN
jgi:hypothetical protein